MMPVGAGPAPPSLREASSFGSSHAQRQASRRASAMGRATKRKRDSALVPVMTFSSSEANLRGSHEARVHGLSEGVLALVVEGEVRAVHAELEPIGEQAIT